MQRLIKVLQIAKLLKIAIQMFTSCDYFSFIKEKVLNAVRDKYRVQIVALLLPYNFGYQLLSFKLSEMANLPELILPFSQNT